MERSAPGFIISSFVLIRAPSTSTERLPTRQRSSSSINSQSSLKHFGMKPENLRDLVPCEKCGRSSKVIESERTKSNSRRRRFECMSCGHRSTRYEVSAAFYHQSIENERVFQQLKLYMDKKSGVVNTHTNDCSTCEYTDGKKCSFDVPEFGTEEAEDCTYYAIKKCKPSPKKRNLAASI